MNRMNEAGYALLRAHEGLRLSAYICPGGVLTIGYGHTGNVKPLQNITLEQAEQFLRDDVVRFALGVSNLVRVRLNDNQFSALVCFAFNVGLRAFAHSTLLDLLNRKWYSQVPIQLMRWTKSRGKELAGLIARRQAEVDLWNLPIHEHSGQAV